VPIFVGTAVFFVNFLLMIIFGVIVSIVLIPMAVISALLVIVGALLSIHSLKYVQENMPLFLKSCMFYLGFL